MYVIPAIDLMNGKAVRLERGLKNKLVMYSDNPVECALNFQAEGAKVLHIVDLNAAFDDGHNRETIRAIVEAVDMEVEVGGGIRDLVYLKGLLDLGINRAIIGTAAFTNESFFVKALEDYADKIALSCDIKEGKLAIKGWVETVEQSPTDTLRRFEAKGLQYVIYTDVSKDGMLEGPNIDSTRKLVELTSLKVIAAGGVSSLSDLQELQKIEGLFGAITGKAIYEKHFTVKEAVDFLAK